MPHTRPIISVEDDEDDQYLIKRILEELGVPNKLIFFQNGQKALDYLTSTKEKPLLIFCDINMPVMNGLELLEVIESSPYLKKKAIPFIFLSTSADKHTIEYAYQLSVQGYFVKESNFDVYRNRIGRAVHYWLDCLHPNNVA